MKNTRSDPARGFRGDMAVYLRKLSEENSSSERIRRLRRTLRRVMENELSEKQRRVLDLYYGRRLNMTQIGELLGVDKSTVCRTLHRGEDRIRRFLRYSEGLEE